MRKKQKHETIIFSRTDFAENNNWANMEYIEWKKIVGRMINMNSK